MKEITYKIKTTKEVSKTITVPEPKYLAGSILFLQVWNDNIVQLPIEWAAWNKKEKQWIYYIPNSIRNTEYWCKLSPVFTEKEVTRCLIKINNK